MLGEAKCGINSALEREANEWLRRSREGVTALSEKKDFFTEDQMALRHDHEVYNHNGFPDPHICSGLFKRAYNPSIGTRPKRKIVNEEY